MIDPYRFDDDCEVVVPPVNTYPTEYVQRAVEAIRNYGPNWDYRIAPEGDGLSSINVYDESGSLVIQGMEL